LEFIFIWPAVLLLSAFVAPVPMNIRVEAHSIVQYDDEQVPHLASPSEEEQQIARLVDDFNYKFKTSKMPGNDIKMITQ
jgi:hypothetical protein